MNLPPAPPDTPQAPTFPVPPGCTRILDAPGEYLCPEPDPVPAPPPTEAPVTVTETPATSTYTEHPHTGAEHAYAAGGASALILTGALLCAAKRRFAR